MTNKFILAAAGGGAPAEVTTDNLKVHYDFGDSNCWTTQTQGINDLSGNNNNANWQYSSYQYYAANGGYAYKNNTSELLPASYLLKNNGSNPYAFEFWCDFEGLGSPGYGHIGLLLNYLEFHKNFSTGQNRLHYAFVGYDFVGTNNSGQTTLGLVGNNMQADNSVWTGYSSSYLTTYYDTSNASGVGPHIQNSNTGWEQIVFARENTNANGFKVYRNGTLLYTGTDNKNYNPTLLSGFSSLVHQFWYFGGVSAKIGIMRQYYGGSLTEAQVLGNYNAQKTRFGLS